MDNLITIDDFIFPYNVVADTEAAISNLNNVIAIAQIKYLKELLGPIEYNKMESNITETWWVNFIDGVTYQKDTGTTILDIVYPGIKPVLAHLIYYDWQKAVQQARMKRGTANLTSENAPAASPKYLIVEARKLALTEIKTGSEYDPTVYNYLEYIEDNIPEWSYSQIKPLNTIGI